MSRTRAAGTPGSGEAAPGRNRPWLIVALAPLALGAVASLLLLTRPGVELVVRVAVAALPVLVGATLTAVLGLVRLGRARRHRARVRARDDGRALEREAHRRFLARLDHELKNPLTAVRAAVAALDDAAAEPAERAAHLAALDAQATRLGLLVADLRKLAELETGPIEHERVDVAEVISEAAADMREQAPAAGFGRRTIDVALPRAPWPLPHVRGDVDLIYLAIYNLLSNAVKFSAPGAPIEVRGTDDGGDVVVEVADSGIGIPASEAEGVFDELARASSARGIPGSGLGLPLVRVIARRHGGDVTLRSREGQGTSVRLRLPAAEG